MKPKKATGLDGIRTEQIETSETRLCSGYPSLTNNWILASQIPKLWRKARVVDLLKPGKDPADVKGFRHVSLLCYLFKIMKWMVLTCISDLIDEKLIPKQDYPDNHDVGRHFNAAHRKLFRTKINLRGYSC